MADMSWVRCVAFVRRVHTGCHRLWPFGSAVAAGVARAAGESDRYGSAAGHVVYCADRRHAAVRHRACAHFNLPSYEAADGCTVLMKDPLLVVARAKATASAKHSAL